MATEISPSWITRKHPLHSVYARDERRQRASYVATLSALTPFLVPHRYEGGQRDMDPQARAQLAAKLIRAQLGYGLGLNKGYLNEILGHARSAPARWTWGPMDPGASMEETEQQGTAEAPASGVAKQLWDDATRDGVPWANFFHRTVLEWMLSSPGGLVVVDTPKLPQDDEGNTLRPSREQAREAGFRPYVRHMPFSAMEDFGRWDFGFRWVKLREASMGRDPKRSPKEPEDDDVRILYQLNSDGRTVVSRHKPNGDQVGQDVDLGKLVDPQGHPTLPIVPAKFGEHPKARYMGTGLLDDLADIIIDLFNVMSETREAYRDSAFSLLVHRGRSGEKVQQLIEEGTRFVDLGDDEWAELHRLAGSVQEVAQGLELFNTGIDAWSSAAKRKAREAEQRAQARSGVALQAEFQLDLAPLLREVVSELDQVETTVMWIAGQLAEKAPAQLSEVGVERSREFRPEEESGRIARISSEARDAGLPVPPDAVVQLAMAWLDAVDQVDLDQEVEGPETEDGETTMVTLREIMRQDLETLAQAEFTEQRNRGALFAGAGQGGEGLPPFPTEPTEE